MPLKRRRARSDAHKTCLHIRLKRALLLLFPLLTGRRKFGGISVGLSCCQAGSSFSAGFERQWPLFLPRIGIGGFWRFSAEGAGSAVCYCLSRFGVRQNFQCRSLVPRWDVTCWRGFVYCLSQQRPSYRKINKRIIAHPVIRYWTKSTTHAPCYK